MNDIMLTGAIKAHNFAHNVTQDMASRAKRVAKGEGEKGDVVQTVIIIGIFVIICVVVGTMITKAMSSQGTTLSNCISKVNTKAGCASFSK